MTYNTLDIQKELPPGWESTDLGSVAEYINGRGFRKYEWSDKGLPIIRIENLNNEEKEHNYFSGEILDKHKVSDGDLLISWSASLDAYLWERGPAALNQHIFKVIPDTKIIDKKFLFFQIKNIISEIRKKAHGGGMVHVTKNDFEKIKISLPMLSEQKRIVSILNEQMVTVEKAKKAAEERLEAAKALPAAYLRDVFEGEEAESWPSYSLGEVLEFKNGVNFSGDKKGTGLLTVDVINMYSDGIHPNYERLYRVDISPSEDYYLNSGDILFVRSSVKKEGVGWPSLFQGFTEPMTYCGFLIRGRPLKTGLSSSFLVHQLRIPRIRHEIIESSGTTAITNISQLKLKAIEVKIPDQSKQVEVLSKSQVLQLVVT